MRSIALHTARTFSLLLLLGCFSENVAAKFLEKTSVDIWEIAAVSDDQTDAFSHCSASAIYANGMILAFFVGSEFNWQIGLANPAWQLVPNSRYPITYQIDDSPLFTAEAVVTGPDMVTVPMKDSSSLFELFRKGWELRIRAAGGEFKFPLQSSSKALTAVLNCARRYALAESQSENLNPFVAPGAARTDHPAKAAQRRAEAATITANILASAGIKGFTLADSLSGELSAFDALWWTDSVMGWTLISEENTVESAVGTLLASASKNCKGAFASMKLPSAKASAARLKTVCENPGQAASVEFMSVVSRKKGGVYVFVVFDSSEEKSKSSILEDAGARLFAAGLALAGE